jgi:hypothetical protein
MDWLIFLVIVVAAGSLAIGKALSELENEPNQALASAYLYLSNELEAETFRPVYNGGARDQKRITALMDAMAILSDLGRRA